MTELIAIEHTHETAVITFLTGTWTGVPLTGSQTAVRLSLGVTSL